VPAPKAGIDAPVPSGATAPAVPGSSPAAVPTGEKIVVKTDLFVANVDTVGGVLTQLALNAHRDTHDESKPYVLLQQNADRTFIAQSGLLGEGMPNHRTVWQALPGPRELAPGMDTLELKLQATTASGDKVVQTLTFHRGSYVIDVTYQIMNAGAAPIAPFAYFQLTRDTKTPDVQSSMAPAAYTGPVIYNETDKFKKVDHGELDKLAADPARKLPYTKNTDNGWVGMIERYFSRRMAASGRPSYLARVLRQEARNGLYADGVILQAAPIAPGATGEIKVPLYAGPQEQDTLAKLATGLDLVVDYGIFTILAAPLFWLLKWLHGIVHNWGWAIVLLTIIIKSAFYPLNHASARSMAKMKVIAPKDEGTAGAVRQRQATAPDQDDGDVQDREDQSARWLPPDRGADSGLHRALLGAALGRGATPRTVDLVDSRFVGAGPLFRPAGHLRDHGLPAGPAVPHAHPGSGAGG
jgi:YidC/Oxa1 family membrane protein insertase